MATGCVLVLDQGGHASRALVFDPRGRVLAQAERRIATRRLGALKVEHSANAVLRSLLDAAAEAVAALPAGTEVGCAALATQRSSIVCWDRETLRPLSPVLSWQDRRAARKISALAGHGTRVRRLTGLVLSPHYGATKLAWCIKHVPAARRAAGEGRLAAGPLASFLAAGLTGQGPGVTDPVNGFRTQLMDLETMDWSAELCELFDVPRGVLPRCVANRYDFGALRIAGRHIPLTVVTGDQPAALFAQGPPDPRTAYINIGTGAFVQALADEDVPGLLRSVLWRDADRTLFALEGTVNGAAAALDAMAKQRGLDPAKLLRLLPSWLAESREPPLFLNGVGGLAAPFWQPEFRTRFVGSGDTPARMTAVVESIAFLLLTNLKRMQDHGLRFTRLRVSGGLSRLDRLCRRLASLSGLPVERAESQEATAMGLARLAGGLTEAPPLSSARFEPTVDVALAARQRRWRDALNAALRTRK
ncbi:MAG TPA: FGGY family carbohydrate kinase [Gammaproteobacteria bacterium]|nr:FGGY family carbohydrate kinase [Gammaproteobacteria bacterium]